MNTPNIEQLNLALQIYKDRYSRLNDELISVIVSLGEERMKYEELRKQIAAQKPVE
jgi:predicted  nucleic acid-binding Zn-ribbon protein